jgi:hypothetical protein
MIAASAGPKRPLTVGGAKRITRVSLGAVGLVPVIGMGLIWLRFAVCGGLFWLVLGGGIWFSDFGSLTLLRDWKGCVDGGGCRRLSLHTRLEERF